MIVHDTVAAFIAVYHAVLAWLIVVAVAASMVAGAAAACVADGTRMAWGRLNRRLPAEHAPEVPPEPRTAHKPAQRRVPSWAHTDHHHDLEEAA